MIGGKILSYKADGEIITFHVKEKESSSTCHVKAKMSLAAQSLIDIGSDIWWQGWFVYIRFDEVGDNKFEKIGFSY